MKVTIFLLALFFFPLFSWCGGGGFVTLEGGIGVTGVNSNRVYLLDFFNSQVHNDITIKPCQFQTAPYSLSNLRAKGISEAIKPAIICQINWLSPADPIFAEVLFKTINAHEWVYTDENLVVTEYSSPFQIKKRVVQVAVRRTNQVYINRALWNRMDLSNQVGLIFHEALHSLVSDRVNTERVRLLTAKIFTAASTLEITTALDRDFPSVYQLQQLYPSIKVRMLTTYLDIFRTPASGQDFTILGNNAIASTQDIVISQNEGELRLFPFIVYTFSKSAMDFMPPSLHRYGYFFDGKKVPTLLIDSCVKATSTYSLGRYTLTDEKLEGVSLYTQRIRVSPERESPDGTLKPRMVWSLDSYQYHDFYDFKESNLSSGLINCGTSGAAKLQKLLQDLGNFKPILDVMLPRG